MRCLWINPSILHRTFVGYRQTTAIENKYTRTRIDDVLPCRRFMQFWGRKSYDSYPHIRALHDPPHTLIQSYKREQARCIVLLLARWAYCAGQGLIQSPAKKGRTFRYAGRKSGFLYGLNSHLVLRIFHASAIGLPSPGWMDLIERLCRAHFVGVFVVFTLHTASTLESWRRRWQFIEVRTVDGAGHTEVGLAQIVHFHW